MGRGSGTYNPYAANASSPPPQMAGRDAEQAKFQSIVDELSAGGTNQHILLTGLRGTGKTSLLTVFSDMCNKASWQATIKEVRPETHIGELIGMEARAALLRMSAKERIKDRVQKALRV